jgi:hypothetical protein
MRLPMFYALEDQVKEVVDSVIEYLGATDG